MKRIASTLVGSADIAINGNLYGGTMMEWCDRYGGLFAIEFLNQPMVTYKVGSVHFLKPAKLGELIIFYVNNLKFNKISVSFDMIARTKDNRELINTNMTFVAIDPETGKPVTINPFVFEREEFETGVRQKIRTTKTEKELKAISIKIKPFNLDLYKKKYVAMLYMIANDNDHVAAIAHFQSDYGKILDPALISNVIKEISLIETEKETAEDVGKWKMSENGGC